MYNIYFSNLYFFVYKNIEPLVTHYSDENFSKRSIITNKAHGGAAAEFI